jgi:hypothetical protein
MDWWLGIEVPLRIGKSVATHRKRRIVLRN